MAYNVLKIFRRDADTSAVADGQIDQLNTNAVGRLKVSQWPGAFVTTTQTIATAATTGTAIDISRSGSVTVQLDGTHAGVNVTFEASVDGTNYVGIPASPISATTPLVLSVSTGVLASNSTTVWDISPLLGVNFFRVRSTAYTSGTLNVRISPSASVVEYQPVVTLGTSTAAIGTVNIGNTANTTPILTRINPQSTGGAITFTLVSAASTNATSVKTAAATLFSLNAYNNGAAAAYLKIYNKASAPTVGTDVPVRTIMLPAGGGSNVFFPVMGEAFTTGIAYAITGGVTTADTTAVAANQVIVNGSTS